MINPEQFARAIAERLTPILPAGFFARAEEGVVYIDAPDGLGAATSVADLLDQDDLDPQDYADAAWAILSLAQDVVSETTSDPWPAPLGPGTDLAEPGTRRGGWPDTHSGSAGRLEQPVVTLRLDRDRIDDRSRGDDSDRLGLCFSPRSYALSSRFRPASSRSTSAGLL